MIMLTADSDKFDDFDVFDDFDADHVTMMRLNDTGVQLHYVEAGRRRRHSCSSFTDSQNSGSKDVYEQSLH